MSFTRIRQRRRMLDITQEELAEKAGISRTTLWKLENGRTVRVSTETLFCIANILECDVDDLISEKSLT